jgi:toxin YoeB
MIYKVEITPDALADLVKLKRSEPVAYKKALSLIRELEEHPKIGTGHPKRLGGDRSEQWSRHISHKHKLVYKIFEDIVLVLVLSSYGHYDDK